jgi:hypothetical protein
MSARLLAYGLFTLGLAVALISHGWLGGYFCGLLVASAWGIWRTAR